MKEYGFHGAMIRGLTQDLFLDHPRFASIFERAEKPGVSIYLHLELPPKGSIACYGWGWYLETAIHVLRLLYADIILISFPRSLLEKLGCLF